MIIPPDEHKLELAFIMIMTRALHYFLGTNELQCWHPPYLELYLQLPSVSRQNNLSMKLIKELESMPTLQINRKGWKLKLKPEGERAEKCAKMRFVSKKSHCSFCSYAWMKIRKMEEGFPADTSYTSIHCLLSYLGVSVPWMSALPAIERTTEEGCRLFLRPTRRFKDRQPCCWVTQTRPSGCRAAEAARHDLGGCAGPRASQRIPLLGDCPFGFDGSRIDGVVQIRHLDSWLWHPWTFFF